MKIYYQKTYTEKRAVDIGLGELLDFASVRDAVEFFESYSARVNKYEVIEQPIKDIETGEWNEIDKGYFKDLLEENKITKECLKELLNETI